MEAQDTQAHMISVLLYDQILCSPGQPQAIVLSLEY